MSEIKYPIKVKKIEFEGGSAYSSKRYGKETCGKFVAIRPCADIYENKTYLGILLGDIAVTQGCSFDEKSGALKIYQTMQNPAIFIPDKNAVVFGYESWWGEIKSADQLKQITDVDIQNVWYVKALKEMAGGEAEGK